MTEKTEKKGKRKPVVQHPSQEKKHERHEKARMDTNGYTNHPELHIQAEKRFLSSALQYCGHIDGGDHEKDCKDICDFHERMLDAYELLITT